MNPAPLSAQIFHNTYVIFLLHYYAKERTLSKNRTESGAGGIRGTFPPLKALHSKNIFLMVHFVFSTQKLMMIVRHKTAIKRRVPIILPSSTPARWCGAGIIKALGVYKSFLSKKLV